MVAVTPIYLNPDRDLRERVDDLLSRLTLPEKISQMRNACAAIPRLGIPAYDYWSEALHGIARNGRATVFPQAIGMAATWNPDLITRVADAIAREGRAKFHETLRRNGGNQYCQGLTFWSPNVNIFRDPRWGRGQETWGEDPWLSGELAGAFVRGMQGDDPRYVKTAACAKHYAVHSGPESQRHTFDAQVSQRELYDTYLPAFRKLVIEEKVEAVMGAYNRFRGEPCNASPYLLQEILREEWGFSGHVVSDCGALTDIHAHHHITADGAESAALALKAGCDIGCDTVFYDHLGEAVERGLVTESDIDTALRRTLATRFKLGLFDPPERVPYAAIPMSVVGCQAHRDLAREAAAQSIVLLRNRGNLLPLPADIRSILVVGPNAGNLNVLLGNYYGLNDQMVTFLEGLTGRIPEGCRLEFMPGSLLAHPKRLEKDWSLFSASAFDVVVAFMGLSPLLEGEEGEAVLSNNGDRDDISLPANQRSYLRELAASGAKVVLVLSGGSAIALDGLEELVDAILYAWYPGQEGGSALAQILFGDVSPAGRLPVTFPRTLADLPAFDDYAMDNRTYRYSTSEPIFPFGFGLSYTRFAYSDLDCPATVRMGEGFSLKVTVTNETDNPADEVVQVYLRDLEASCKVPNWKLVGFRRVSLPGNTSLMVEFHLPAEALAYVDEAGKTCTEAGRFEVEVGGCAPGERGIRLGASAPQRAGFSLLL